MNHRLSLDNSLSSPTTSTDTAVTAVILAGGKSTRMNLSYPKVLSPIAKVPMLECILRSLVCAGLTKIIIVGSPFLQAAPQFPILWEKWQKWANEKNVSLHFALQEQSLGTGDALRCAVNYLTDCSCWLFDKLLVCNGDTPLIRPESFQKIAWDQRDCSFLSMTIPNPKESSLGRVLIQNREISGVIEVRDATEQQREQLSLANVGAYGLSKKCLDSVLPHLTNQNKAHEFYITELIKSAFEQKFSIGHHEIPFEEGYGIDTPKALQEAPVQSVLIQRALETGAVIPFPQNTLLAFDTEIGAGAVIDGFTAFGPGVVIEREAHILPFCYLENCIIKKSSTIGPFAHIKEHSTISENATIGNFVEIKNSDIGAFTKIKHLSYVGDAQLGQKVNIGAGSVFCNYDGWTKHKTVVKDGAKIGANTSLVAPLTINENAFIGAGSVITEDVQAYALALSRTRQAQRPNWVKKRLAHKQKHTPKQNKER